MLNFAIAAFVFGLHFLLVQQFARLFSPPFVLPVSFLYCPFALYSNIGGAERAAGPAGLHGRVHLDINPREEPVLLGVLLLLEGAVHNAVPRDIAEAPVGDMIVDHSSFLIRVVVGALAFAALLL